MVEQLDGQLLVELFHERAGIRQFDCRPYAARDG